MVLVAEAITTTTSPLEAILVSDPVAEVVAAIKIYHLGTILAMEATLATPAQTPMGQETPAQTPMGQETPAQTPMGQETPAQAPMGQDQETPAQAPMGQDQETPAQAPMGQDQETPAQTPMDQETPAQTPMDQETPAQTPMDQETPAQTPMAREIRVEVEVVIQALETSKVKETQDMVVTRPQELQGVVLDTVTHLRELQETLGTATQAVPTTMTTAPALAARGMIPLLAG